MEDGFPFLVFTRNLERHFLIDNLDARRKFFFVMTIIAIFIYNLFLFTDREMLPDIYRTAWQIRLGIVTPSMLIILAMLHYRVFIRYIDFMADFLIVLTASSIIMILYLSHHPNVVHYHTGVILIIMFGNIVVRLRFWHALGVSWLIFFLYVLTVPEITSMPPPVMINSSVVLFSAIIISLIGNYQIESALRRNYLRNLLKEIETIRLEKAKTELELISSLDVLTGLANRRNFDTFLDTEWQMGAQYRTPLSLLFLDVDDFKAYNDHYGHQAGDACLRKIAEVLKRCIHRSRDLCARYGGEEFVVLLPNTDVQSAFQIAEKLRNNIELENIPNQHSRVVPYVTVSVGVASMMPQKTLPPQRLVELADRALYRAKDLGRNQVQVLDDENNSD
ncbi:MAG: diguanylate cyclase [Deltaproteobacteria bacterium]|nr:diguanylate cyclase [Deltaproteobacteria bacterium]